MTPFLLLALGMAIVLSLVIWLKLHPFLALTFAAVVVSFSTPQTSLDNYAENHTRSQIKLDKMTEPKATQFKEDFKRLSPMLRVVKEFGGGCA